MKLLYKYMYFVLDFFLRVDRFRQNRLLLFTYNAYLQTIFPLKVLTPELVKVNLILQIRLLYKATDFPI